MADCLCRTCGSACYTFRSAFPVVVVVVVVVAVVEEGGGLVLVGARRLRCYVLIGVVIKRTAAENLLTNGSEL